MAKLKASKLDVSSNFELDLDKGKHIIYVEPNAIISMTKVQESELEYLEEGEHLFRPQLWVKGDPLYFIADGVCQKNLISVEVIKQLNLLKTLHAQPYTMGWLS